ncbi:FAD-binding oxidoreductase, partial [Ectothiorhodospiraceae bacterium WFHF3C12]|nr:FAD-binding oxidoreductase [Ectothiorhodospiraceae bacterium WFHF3C12]
PGRRKPVPFIEDTVVPPERLPEYIAALRTLLERHGLEYAMFGHVDVGCLHVRPALDMTDPDDAALVRPITEAVIRLLQRHQGLLWGEHGKGFRGEYARAFFGEALYPLLAEVKRAFDPDNRMNPGKIVAPDGDPSRIEGIDTVPLRGEYDRQIAEAVRRHWSDAMNCNGNGVCFDWDARQAICPSYKVTRDRIHSPKGRAGLLREWLRRLAREGLSPEDSPGVSPRRRRADDPDDFSHAVYDALQGCLGCKACATQCPVHVDIPEMRGRFLASYHRRYRRPARDYLLGALEHLAPPASTIAPAVNAALDSGPGRRLSRRLGLADLPGFARANAHRRLSDAGVAVLDAESVTDLSDAEIRRSVFVLGDTFTTYLDPAVPTALASVVRAVGLTPVVIASRPSGKALQVQGFMDAFHNTALAQTKRLARVSSLGRPVVGLDPSVTLTYRDEIRRAVGQADWSPPLLPQEWLNGVALSQPAATDTNAYRLFLHCTEQTAQPRAAEQWRAVFRRSGLTLEVVPSGCCGMAGTYGHLAEHQDHSRGLYDLSWRESAEAVDPARVLATGYSCRSQVQRFSGFRPAHPLEVLARQLGG